MVEIGKHTPGPWSWHDPDNDQSLDYSDEGFIMAGDVQVCSFGNSESYDQLSGEVPTKADIALICAAPDLLEAARAAARLLPPRVCERHGITSAIAKATGQ